MTTPARYSPFSTSQPLKSLAYRNDRVREFCEEGDPRAVETALKAMNPPRSEKLFPCYLMNFFPHPDQGLVKMVAELEPELVAELARNPHLGLEEFVALDELARRWLARPKSARYQRAGWRIVVGMSQQGVIPDEEMLEGLLGTRLTSGPPDEEMPMLARALKGVGPHSAIRLGLPIEVLPTDWLYRFVEAAQEDSELLRAIARHRSATGKVWCAVLDACSLGVVRSAVAAHTEALEVPGVRSRLRKSRAMDVLEPMLATARGGEARELFVALAQKNIECALEVAEQMKDEQLEAIEPADLRPFLSSEDGQLRRRGLMLAARVGKTPSRTSSITPCR